MLATATADKNVYVRSVGTGTEFAEAAKFEPVPVLLLGNRAARQFLVLD
jgi:hypothetical protein